MDVKPQTQFDRIVVDILFYSPSVEQNFMTCLNERRCIIINAVEQNGHFNGETIKGKLSGGHLQRPSTLVTGRLEANSNIEHKFRHSHVASPVSIGSPRVPTIKEDLEQIATNSTNVIQEPSTTLQADGHSQLPDPVPKTLPSEIKLSTVESSSQRSSHPSSQQAQKPRPTSGISSASEHKASDKGSTNTSLAIIQDKDRVNSELRKKRNHTIYCLLHGQEVLKCPFYSTKEECHDNYDKLFANEFEQFLSKGPDAIIPSASNKDQKSDNKDYLQCIKEHLKSKNCPSCCSRLWSFCATFNMCYLYKYADEGHLIHSKTRDDKVGSICDDYINIKFEKDVNLIGKGGFGKVYLIHSKSGDELAVKKEEKHPLVDGDAKLFKQIMALDHPHVIEIFEYLVGPSEDGKWSCLLVMPFMNQKGLDEQFKLEENCKCVVNYIAKYHHQRRFVFRNYLEIFHQVFEGLDYLSTQKIVHRDIKSSNILVHKWCDCESSLMCTCPEGNKTLYVLGDMDLLCKEGESAFGKCEKMAMNEPAGTIEMKPPESFYRTGEGDPVISHKSDVWSGGVTMMNVLVGRELNTVPHEQIGTFLKTTTKIVKEVSCDIDQCCEMLETILKKVGSLNATSDLTKDFDELKEVLSASNISLKKVQSFQGGIPETYKEESPLAGILSTVYVANSLHWECLTVLPRVYNTPLWNCISDTLKIIAEAVRFIPENRENASEILKLLNPIEAAVKSS